LLGGVALVGLVGAGTAPAGLTLPVRLAAEQAPVAAGLWTSDDSGGADGSGSSSGSGATGCTDGSCGSGTRAAGSSTGGSSAEGGATPVSGQSGSAAPAGSASTGPAPSSPTDPSSPGQTDPVQTPPVLTPPSGGNGGSAPSSGSTGNGGGNPSSGGSGNASSGAQLAQQAASSSQNVFSGLLSWIQNLIFGGNNAASASNSGGQSNQASQDSGSVRANISSQQPAQAAPAAVPSGLNGNKFATAKGDSSNDPASQMIQGVLTSITRVISTVVPESGQS
jgi:hypothetical protein